MKARYPVMVSLSVLLAACGSEELPRAADGTDLAACSDGSCEVRVTTGDRLDVPDLDPVEVVVEDDRIQVSARSDDGQGNSSSVSAGGVAGHTLVLNRVEFTVVAVLDGQGVLRVDG